MCECVPFDFRKKIKKFWNMSAPTPNNNNNNNSGNGGQSGDCLEQDVAAAAAASKNAFLELHQQAVNLHGSMHHHSPHMSHMSAGYQLGRSPYAGGPHSMAAHSNSAAAAAAAAAGHQLAGAYPFSHMTPQNSYSAAGYHHLSPYPTAQCPQSPPRDGRSNFKVFNLNLSRVSAPSFSLLSITGFVESARKWTRWIGNDEGNVVVQFRFRYDLIRPRYPPDTKIRSGRVRGGRLFCPLAAKLKVIKR